MDKELLFKARLTEEDVEVAGVGTVRVRGLSRVEVLHVRKAADDAGLDGPRTLTLERKMLALAMVDPELTEAEVGKWQAASGAGELNVVTDKVQELSGMKEDSAKAAYKSAGGES